MPSPSSEAMRFEVRRILRASPQRAWPIVSDTDAFNQALGLAPWSFVDKPDDLGGSIRTGSFRAFGATIAWREHPFDWVAGQGFSVLREYESGPFSTIVAKLLLDPDGDQTELSYTVVAQARGTLWRLVARAEMRRAQTGCERVFEQVARYLEGEAAEPYPAPPPKLQPSAPKVLATLEEHLASRGIDRALIDHLAQTIRQRPDRDVQRMSPAQLANVWGAPRATVLAMFLEASRAGALDPTWDMVCPLCRGAKHRVSARERLPSDAFCASCNAMYDVVLDDTVELSFRPSVELRIVKNETWCVGGPGNTRHILVQRGLPAGDELEAALELPPGLYRLRSPRSAEGAIVRVELDPGGAPAGLEIGVDRRAVRSSLERFPAGRIALRVKNLGDVEQVIKLERLDAPGGEVITGIEAYGLRGWDDVLAGEIDCASFGPMVELAAAGSLSAAAQEALERHLGRCDACAERFAGDSEALAMVAFGLDRGEAPPRPFESLLAELDEG